MKLFRIPLLLLVTALPTTKANHTSSILSLHGSGTTNPSKCLWAILDQFMDRIKVPTRLTYRAVGSITGQEEFKGDNSNFNNSLIDFGSGDIPFSTEDYNNLTNAGVEIVHLPILFGAISFFHSVPGITEELGDGLQLDSCLLAKIFRRNITNWGDDEILALNPNKTEELSANYPITVAHRFLGSSSTYGITKVSYPVAHSSRRSRWISVEWVV
jgi:ABC-type phosphate transport system substrate-binding protein